MKKKKLLYSILNVLMALLLTFSSLAFRPDLVMAVEEEAADEPEGDEPPVILADPVVETPEADPVVETPKVETPKEDKKAETPKEDPVEQKPEQNIVAADTPAQPIKNQGTVQIAVNTRVISFGEVEEDSAVVDFKGVIVTNTGTATTTISYQVTGNGYEFNAPGPYSIAPGESTTIYTRLKSSMEPGTYTANLVIVPDVDPTKTVNVGITGQIVHKSAYITSMAVVPGSVSLAPGSSYSFSADVKGVNNPDTRVNWKVSGNNSAATKIDNKGNLTVGSDETATSFKVIITSVTDPSIWEFATVTVQEGKYSVTTRSNPANGGTTSGGTTVKSGDNVQLLAAPNNGYKFVSWTIDGKVVSNDQKYVVSNVRNNIDVVANFSQTNCYVKIKSNHPEGGKISDSVNVLYGGETTIKAEAKSGFEFIGWYEDDEKISSKEKYTLTNITSNRTITAKFEKTSYVVNVNVYPEQSGVVFGSGSFTKGTNVTLTAKSVDGYVFDGWIYNNDVVSRDSSITIKKIDKDYSVTAAFRKSGSTQYAIKASVAEGKGSITPSGTNSFVKGENITYRFSPSNGYMISAVYVDGANIGAASAYTFEKLSGAHSISVKFAKLAADAATTATISTPANKESSEQAKEEKENTQKELADVIEQADADAAELENVQQLDPEAVAEFLAYTEQTGVLQELDVTEDDARNLIRNKQDLLLLEKAAADQYLAVSVNNDYSSTARETESASYFEVASLPNLADVVDSILTEDEKISCFKGNPIQVNMNIFANNQIQTEDDKKMVDIAMRNKMSVGNFFEAVLMKSDSGRTENITELEVPMQIVLEIPDDLKADGREYYIIRAHETADGTVFDILGNESKDPNRIIFTTDKFSSYAICYKGGKSVGMNQMKLLNMIIVILLVLIGAAISVLLIVSINESKKRKLRRAHAQKR